MAIADQYEVLRSAALGEALPFKASGGLMLFCAAACGDGPAHCLQRQAMTKSSFARHQPPDRRTVRRRRSCPGDHHDEHPPTESTMNVHLKVQSHHRERSAYP